MEELLGQGEKLPKDMALRQNSKLLLKRSSANLLKGPGQGLRESSDQYLTTMSMNKSTESHKFTKKDKINADNISRKTNLLLNAARYQEQNEITFNKIRTVDPNTQTPATIKDQSSHALLSKDQNDYGTLDHVRGRSNTVAHLFKPSPSQQEQMAVGHLDKYDTVHDRQADRLPVADEEDLTSIVQIIDDGPGSFGRRRELEVASGFGSHVSVANHLTMNEAHSLSQ